MTHSFLFQDGIVSLYSIFSSNTNTHLPIKSGDDHSTMQRKLPSFPSLRPKFFNQADFSDFKLDSVPLFNDRVVSGYLVERNLAFRVKFLFIVRCLFIRRYGQPPQQKVETDRVQIIGNNFQIQDRKALLILFLRNLTVPDKFLWLSFEHINMTFPLLLSLLLLAVVDLQ